MTEKKPFSSSFEPDDPTHMIIKLTGPNSPLVKRMPRYLSICTVCPPVTTSGKAHVIDKLKIPTHHRASLNRPDLGFIGFYSLVSLALGFRTRVCGVDQSQQQSLSLIA
jgi:hypothetical protein